MRHAPVVYSQRIVPLPIKMDPFVEQMMQRTEALPSEPKAPPLILFPPKKKKSGCIQPIARKPPQGWVVEF